MSTAYCVFIIIIYHYSDLVVKKKHQTLFEVSIVLMLSLHGYSVQHIQRLFHCNYTHLI